MWLIIEGIDGAGKTTLARKIVEAYPQFVYRHVGPPGCAPPLIDGEWGALARTWYQEEAENVVWDRGHLGELVYGIDRGFDVHEFSPENGWLRLLEAILMNRAAPTIWLARDPKVAHASQPLPGARSLSELLAHHYRYAKLVNDDRLTLPPITCEGETAQAHVLSSMPKALELERSLNQHHDNEGVGALAPDVWVVGEQRSPASWCPAPFATPSGVELVWPVINPRRVRVSNVARPGWGLERVRLGLTDEMRDDLYRRWASLREPRVITLGRTAERACLVSDVPVHAALEHPQYSRRFYYLQGPAYRERLTAALRSAGDDSGVAVGVTAMEVSPEMLHRLLRGLLGGDSDAAGL